MPRFEVEALEKFLIRTIYYVEAANPQQAEELCRAGKVGYEYHSVEEGDDEWIETLSVEEVTPFSCFKPTDLHAPPQCNRPHPLPVSTGSQQSAVQ